MRSRSVTAALAVLLLACGPDPQPVTPKAPPPADAAVADPAVAARPAPPEAPALQLPGNITPTGYTLRLELDATKETYAGAIEIAVDINTPSDFVWLHADRLEIASAELQDGREARPITRVATSAGDLVGFDLGKTTRTGPHTLRFTFTGQVSARAFDGLFRQQVGEAWYLFSQFEATSARQAFPCFDEPRFKVPWEVTLVVPDGQGGYGNGAQVAEESLGDGRRAIRFAKTPPIPSYLVAVAVGPFDVVDGGAVGQHQIPSRILTPAGRAADAATAVAEMPRIVAALERYFDMPLPFDKLDSVVIPRFFGAMENPGLITYAEGILLAPADQADDGFRQRLVSIAGHELAHQWFGNYVTLAWWDDIWLNESFATWMAEKVAAELEPTWDGASSAVEQAGQAMAADARLEARPLHRTIASADDIMGLFDSISYAKGGAVLTMFERWIGEDAFRTGVRAYMKAHARGSATSADFLAALAAASTPEVGEHFEAYLEQPGVPVLDLTLTCGQGKAAVEITQRRLVGFGETAPEQRWPVRACVRSPQGKGTVVTCADVTTASARLDLPGKTCPAWIAGNAAGGYYRVRYGDALLGKLGKHLGKLPLGERLGLAADVRGLLRAGQADAGDALGLASALLATGDAHDLGSAVALIRATEALVADDLQPAWRAWVVRTLGKRAGKAPLQPPRGEAAAVHEGRQELLELVGVIARDARLGARARTLVRAGLDDAKAEPPADLQLMLALAARGGDAALFDAMLARARTAEPRTRGALLGALGYFAEPALMTRAHEVLAGGEFDRFEAGAVLQAQLESPDGARAANAYLRANWDAVMAGLPAMVAPFVMRFSEALCDTAARAEVEAFFTPRVDSVPKGAEVLAEILTEIDRCVARREQLGGDVAKAIAGR